MSFRSPKAKYIAEVTLDEARGTIGGDSYSGDSIDVVKHLAELFARGEGAYVRIEENRKHYPEFEWVCIESYKINQK